jgi:nucleoside-diphosphate-sugar epimerase
MVFHLAALTKIISPQDFFHINEEGTMSLLEKLRPLKKLRKIILLSSLAAAGPNRDHAFLTEDMPEKPVSLYGKSKLAQEKICKEISPAPYVIIRAPIVFGPGDLDMLDAFRIVSKGILPLLGRQERRFSIVYVKDLVRGMVAAAISHFENDIFYIANSEPIEWQSFMHDFA